MTELIDKLVTLTGDRNPKKKVDGYWFESKKIEPSDLAKFMSQNAIRLSTMTAVEREDGETDIIYHFINSDVAINIRTKTNEQRIASLGAFLPSANWIEREIRDLYAVHFTGHPDPRPLERPAEMPEGFFRKAIADKLIKEKEAK